MKRKFYLALYYWFAQYLPSYGFFSGNKLRRFCCKHIFKYCGENVTIERRAYFGSGRELSLGDYSGLGVNCVVPGDTTIGKYVMMGPNCHIFAVNHEYKDTETPMCLQGTTPSKKTIIEDDVWIGQNVIMTPGRTIKKGSIVAAGCVLCKDFPAYSIIGGNPSKLIKSRLDC